MLPKEAAYRQRETVRLLQEETDALRGQLAAKQQLSKEAAARVAAALVTAGHIRATDQAKVASRVEQNPESVLEIMERMAAERSAPPSIGGPDTQTKQAGSAKEPSSEDVWNSGPWNL
jgi:hypothetical protein